MPRSGNWRRGWCSSELKMELLKIQTKGDAAMPKKKRKCFICGADLTQKNYAQVFDKANGKVVIVCPGACYKKKMMGGWKNENK